MKRFFSRSFFSACLSVFRLAFRSVSGLLKKGGRQAALCGALFACAFAISACDASGDVEMATDQLTQDWKITSLEINGQNSRRLRNTYPDTPLWSLTQTDNNKTFLTRASANGASLLLRSGRFEIDAGDQRVTFFPDRISSFTLDYSFPGGDETPEPRVVIFRTDDRVEAEAFVSFFLNIPGTRNIEISEAEVRLEASDTAAGVLSPEELEGEWGVREIFVNQARRNDLLTDVYPNSVGLGFDAPSSGPGGSSGRNFSVFAFGPGEGEPLLQKEGSYRITSGGAQLKLDPDEEGPVNLSVVGQSPGGPNTGRSLTLASDGSFEARKLVLNFLDLPFEKEVESARITIEKGGRRPQGRN